MAKPRVGKKEVERFLAEGMYAPSTLKAYRKTLLRFLEKVKFKDAHWEPRAIAFRDAHECGTYGRAFYLAIARSFLNWCLAEGLIGKNPLKKVRIRVPSVSNRSSLSDTEVSSVMKLFAKLTKETKAGSVARLTVFRDRAVVTLMLYTGLRVGGVIGLDVEDFQLNGNGTAILRYKSKGALGKDSTAHVTKLPLAAVAAYLKESVRNWKSSGPLFLNRMHQRVAYTGLTKSVLKRFQTAGVREDASLHWLRHTAATKALKAGADIKAIQKMLDHKHLTATDVYLHSLGGIEDSAEGKIEY